MIVFLQLISEFRRVNQDFLHFYQIIATWDYFYQFRVVVNVCFCVLEISFAVSL